MTLGKLRIGVFFGILLLTYSYFDYGPHGANVKSRLALTFAVVDNGTFIIDDYRKTTKDYSFSDGHYYSNKAPGSSLVAIPFYFIYKIVTGDEAETGRPKDVKTALAFINWGANALPTFLTVLLFYFLVRSLNMLSIDETIFLTAIFGLGTMIFPFASAFFGHCLAMFFVFCGYFLPYRALTEEKYRQKKWLVLAGFMLGFGVFTDYVCILPVCSLFIYLLFVWRSRLPQVFWVTLGGSVMAILLATYNVLCFGSPFTMSVSRSVMSSEFSDGVLFSMPKLSALWGLTFSPYRGMFWYSPVLLLAFVGAVQLFRKNRTLFIFACLGFLPSFVYIISIRTWNGGATYLPRYLITAIPFLCLHVVYGYKVIPKTTLYLAAISFCNMIVSVTVTAEVDQRVQNPLFKVIIPAIFQGEYTSDNWLMRFGIWGPWSVVAIILLWAMFLIFWEKSRRVGRVDTIPHHGGV